MPKPSAKNADIQKRCSSKLIKDKPDNQGKLPFAPVPSRAKQGVGKVCEMSSSLKIASHKAQEEEKMPANSNDRASINSLIDELDRQDADSKSSGTPATVLEIGEQERKRERKANSKAVATIGRACDQPVKQQPDSNDPEQKKRAQSGRKPSLKSKRKQATVCLP